MHEFMKSFYLLTIVCAVGSARVRLGLGLGSFVAEGLRRVLCGLVRPLVGLVPGSIGLAK